MEYRTENIECRRFRADSILPLEIRYSLIDIRYSSPYDLWVIVNLGGEGNLDAASPLRNFNAQIPQSFRR